MNYIRNIYKILRHSFIEKLNVFKDIADITLHAKRIQNDIPVFTKPVLLFVIDKYLPRVEKLIYALENSGYYIIVATKNKGAFKQDSVFEFPVQSYYKIAWLIKRNSPCIVHVFSRWNFDLAYDIIKRKNKIAIPIVFDDYDIFAGMIRENHLNKLFPTQQKREKYCFEHADAHCCRSLEIQYLKQSLNYQINSNSIFFPEYCWNKPQQGSAPLEKTIVYIGNFNKGVLLIANELQKINWNIHIYSAHFVSTTIDIPFNLQIFKPIPPRDLLNILRKYPVAIQFPGCILDNQNSIYTEEKYLYAAAGKIFDYLEAGLMVLAADELFQKWILKRSEALIEIDEKNPLDDIIRKLANFDPQYFNNRKINYSHLTLQNQAGRLIKFYQSLSVIN